VIILKKVAFTDIDGTLVDGFSSIDFVYFLYKKKVVSEEYYFKQKKLVGSFLKGVIDFDKGVKDWLNLLNVELVGVESNFIKKLALEFFKEYRKKIKPSSKELVNFLKSNGYYVVGISSGLEEVNSLISGELKFDVLFCSKMKKTGDFYSKGFLTKIHLKNHKKDFVNSFVNENGVFLENCIGFGDSIQDYGFLSIVGTPVALNPDKKLLDLAKKKKFFIATSEDVISMVNNII
jgi:phosphoserine phosphatase